MNSAKNISLLNTQVWTKKYPGLGHSWEGAAWFALQLAKMGRFKITDDFLLKLHHHFKSNRFPSAKLVGTWRGVGGDLRLVDLASEIDASFQRYIPPQLRRIKKINQQPGHNDYFGGYPSLLMTLTGMRAKSFSRSLLSKCHRETARELKTMTSLKGPIYLGASHGLAGLLMAAEVGTEVFSLKFDRGLLNHALDIIKANEIPVEGGSSLWVTDTEQKLEEPGALRNAFCHGNAGIALALHTCYFVSGNKKYKTIAESALAGSLALGNSRSSLCCGGSGLRQVLIEIYRQNGNQTLLELARKMKNKKAEIGPGLLIGDLGDAFLSARLNFPDVLPFPTLEGLGYG